MKERLMTWCQHDERVCTWCGKTIIFGDSVYMYVSANDHPFPNTVTHVRCFSPYLREDERVLNLAARYADSVLYRGWFE